jgi:hypothetical protein
MDFYRSADATLAKPISAIRAMETLDEVMRSRINAGMYWDGIATMLQVAGVEISRVRALEHEVATAMQRGTKLNQSRIEEVVGHVGTIVTVAELINKAIAFASGG